MRNFPRHLQVASLLLAASGLLFAACSGGGGIGGSSGGGGGGGGNGTGTGTGILNLSVTDAPFQYDIVESASVSVDKITIFHDADSDAGPIVLYEGAPILLDLFNLRDGLSQNVDQSTLPVGTYRQLRLRVSDAELTLTNAKQFTTDDNTIRLTSQGTSGFKVFVDPPIEILEGETTDVLLDFDLTRTFKPVPGNDALTANFYHLHPVIHVANLGHTGGIQGTVTQDDGTGALVPVADATVYVLPPGQTDTSLAVATSGTSATGTYTLLGITPGPYDVIAVKGELKALAAGVTVVSGEVTTVDLTLHETGGIAGTVIKDDGFGGLLPVDGATVYVLPPGQTDVALAVASGATSATGAYSIPIIPRGTYDVRAVKDALNATVAGVGVASGAVAQVDFTLHDVGGVQGTVTVSDGVGGFLPVDAATVYVLPPGQTDPLLAIATTTTSPTGTYSIPVVLTGTYDVRAVKALLIGTAANVAIVSGAVATADILIQ